MNRQSGCVEFAYTISPDGKAENLEIIRSFPGNVFAASGKETIEKWRWAPSAANAERQAVRTTDRLDFTLEGARNSEAAEEACGPNFQQYPG